MPGNAFGLPSCSLWSMYVSSRTKHIIDGAKGSVVAVPFSFRGIAVLVMTSSTFFSPDSEGFFVMGCSLSTLWQTVRFVLLRFSF